MLPLHPIRRPAAGVPALALACLAFLVAGCGIANPPASPSPSPSPSPVASASPPAPSAPASSGPNASAETDPAIVYRELLGQVEDLRGLEAKADITPEALSQDELVAYVETELATITAEEWRTSDALLRHLGLIQTQETLQELFRKLLDSQTAGFYDPEEHRLVVLAKTGEIGAVERLFMSHELTHMLQDQHFDLVKLDSRGVAAGLIRESVDRNDRHLGVLALSEGDATLLMTFWAQGNLTPAEALEVVAASNDPEAMAVLNSMPLILRETLLFPYGTGVQWALGLQAAGGWEAINRAYADLPVSTEQILHREKYPAEVPVEVALPEGLAARLGNGWKASLEDTFGEFDTRIWLQDAGGLPQADAEAAAAGWGGDRLALLEGPDGAWSIAWLTAWDTTADADAFLRAAGTLVGDGDDPGTAIKTAGTEVAVVIASAGPVLDATVAAAGFVPE